MNNQWKDDAPLGLDPDADETARILNHLADGIQPDSTFASKLEQRLAAAHPGGKTGSIFFFNRLAPALIWVVAIALMVFVLDWAIRSLAPQPVPAAHATKTPTLSAPMPPVEQTTPGPSGQGYNWNGTTMYLNAALPGSPSDAAVFLAQPALHATLDEALALAARFGIQGNAYETAGEIPDTIDYLITDGRQSLRVRSSQYFSYTADMIKSFNNLGATQNPEAEMIIRTFLQSRGYSFPYRIEWSDFRNAYVASPLTSDGTPLRYEHFAPPMLLVTLDEAGQVASLQASVMAIQSEPVGRFGILSADEAFQRLLDPSMVNGIVIAGNSVSAPIQQWSRTHPLDQTITIYGNVSSVKAGEAGKPAFIQIDGFLAIGQLSGLEEISLSQSTYVQATGRFVSDNGIQKFNIESWKPSDVNEDGLVGTLRRENDRAILTTDDGATFSLPDIPDDLPMPFERAFVVGTKAGDVFQWKLIDNRMAAQGGGGGGGGGGSGFYKLNLSGTPVAFPTETQAPAIANPSAGGGTLYTVQAGDTLGSIASTFEVSVDGLMQANDIQDPNVLAVGQDLVIPSSGARSVDGLRGVLNVTISKLPDGTESVAYGFLANASSDPGGYMLLKGDSLEALQAFNGRPMDLWGSLTASPDGGIPTLKVDRYEIPFPDLKIQVLQGKQKLTEISGQPATLFTTDDGKTYVQFLGDATTGSSLIGVQGDEVQIEGVAIPDESLGGYPALRVFGGTLAIDPKTGLHMNLPITADRPAVVEVPFIGKTMEMPTAAIEKVELVHFLSDPRYTVPQPDAKPPYFQPVWRFYGHYSNGDEFEILIQALKDEYLLPEVEPGLQLG